MVDVENVQDTSLPDTIAAENELGGSGRGRSKRQKHRREESCGEDEAVDTRAGELLLFTMLGF